ncbi:UNVERIFIED_CONTAM: hypothetical protein GTU68_028115 [Idotea baltica]|nr:hypothetical protein [Idotea baltica]
MLMPQMGESISEATISKWLKKPGDSVEKDEIILEISTDKVDSEIPAPSSGLLTETLFNEGDTVPVKVKIASIDTEKSASSSTSEVKEEAPKAETNQKEASPEDKSERFYSPLVRSLATKHATSPAPKVESKKQISNIQTGDQVIPMDNMRKAIAAHMVRSKQTSPHVYSVQEVDVSKIAKWRKSHKAECKQKEGFNLSFTPFFLEAAVSALLKYPHVNATVENDSVILKKNINLGCAVALGSTGLIVPVIKNAEEKNLIGIARSLNDIALRARDKKLSPDEVMNGTFTVTNPGVFGTIIGTPIINQPQAAILCLGAIEKRPVVVDDMIAIRERCYLTLSYDHRIIDGSLGGQFLAHIRDYLENWDTERSLY